MNHIPIAIQSILLAQEKLSNKLVTNSKHGKIEDSNPCKSTMTNISTFPSFKSDSEYDESERIDFILPIEEVIEMFARKAKSVRERMEISERGQATLIKALKYKIDFDKQNIDWLLLIDEVEEYECLIKEANELGVDWDYRYYDPVGLEQEIKVYEHGEYQAECDANAAYYASR